MAGGKARRASVSPVVWAYILKCVVKSVEHRRHCEVVKRRGAAAAEAKRQQEAADADVARRLARYVRRTETPSKTGMQGL